VTIILSTYVLIGHNQWDTFWFLNSMVTRFGAAEQSNIKVLIRLPWLEGVGLYHVLCFTRDWNRSKRCITLSHIEWPALFLLFEFSFITTQTRQQLTCALIWCAQVAGGYASCITFSGSLCCTTTNAHRVTSCTQTRKTFLHAK